MQIEILGDIEKNSYDRRLKAEMSDEERDFLIHVLKKFSPRKIVEIGVAEGGTSVNILKAAPVESMLYSVDISENLYCDSTKKTGYQVAQFCSKQETGRQRCFYGRDIIDCIDEIGGEIDFCIIDTAHIMPGEILSFLVVSKYLKDNAVIVLHDVTSNHIGDSHDSVGQTNRQYATTVLFSCVKSQVKMKPSVFASIGAFLFSKETMDNIEDVFMSLSINWEYYPEDLIEKYKKFIKNNFSSFCYEYFTALVPGQKRLVSRTKKGRYILYILLKSTYDAMPNEVKKLMAKAYSLLFGEKIHI